MQETEYLDPEDGERKTLKEFFAAQTDEAVNARMEDRLKELQQRGHALVRRVKIGRNDPCPCGSGKKFKRCCIERVRC